MVARQNPDIHAANEQLSSSENLAKAAYSGFLPQVSANANVTKGNSYAFPQLGGVPLNVPAGDNTVSSGSLLVNQNLFAGFKDASLVEQGAANKDLSRAALDSTKVQTSFDLKTSFANLFYAQKYVELTDKIIRRRTENAQIVELHFESGMENKGSVMLSNAFVGQARYDKTVARDSTDVSRQQLARVMGMDDLKEFEITGGIPLSEPGAEPDFKGIARSTPSYRQSAAQEQVNEAGVGLARSNFFPAMDLTGSVAAQGNNSFPDTSKRSVMLNLSVPVFSGGSDYYNYKSASALHAASSYQKQSVDQQLLSKLKQTYRLYVESIEKLNVDKAFLEAAEVRAEIGRSKYNNGLLSFEDWDIIENDLIAKQKLYLLSERDRVLAEAEWELAAGKGVI
jgi:outer membrane protein TolC